MKKSLFMMGVAMAALSSCTQSEVLNVADNNVIKFENAYVGKATRAATVLDNDNFGSFYVYGYNSNIADEGNKQILTNVNVFKGGESAWGYDPLVEYVSGNYTFAAYSNGGTTKGTGQLTNVEFSAPETQNPAKLIIKGYTTTENKDLIVSFSHDNINTVNTPVAFIFKHTLAQVKFTIQSALGDENKIAISKFSVTGFGDNADLTYTMGENHGVDAISWDNLGGSNSDETKTINALDNDVATTSNPASDTYVVIPQTVQTLTMKFDATLYKADGTKVEKKGMTATISSQEFKAGYRYNFIATIDGPDMGQISFAKPIVEEWTDYDANNDGTPDDIVVDPNVQ